MEPFRFSFKELSESGKSVKDYIAPPGFDFRYPSRFKTGKMGVPRITPFGVLNFFLSAIIMLLESAFRP